MVALSVILQMGYLRQWCPVGPAAETFTFDNTSPTSGKSNYTWDWSQGAQCVQVIGQYVRTEASMAAVSATQNTGMFKSPKGNLMDGREQSRR